MKAKDFFKMFFSYYDPAQDEVHAHGRLANLHEQRHHQQRWLVLVMSYWVLASAIFMGMVAVASGSIGLILLFVPPIILMVALETDAWIYSMRMRKNADKSIGHA